MSFELITQLTKALLVVCLVFLLQRILLKLQRKATAASWLPPTLGLIIGGAGRWLVLAVGALIVLEIFGFPLKVVIAGLVSVTLVVAVAFFAYWSVLSNIFSSILLLAFSRIKVGDIVELRETRRDEKGVRGRILDINAFFVTLEELPEDQEDALSGKPPRVQIPSHFFFYRTMRHWPQRKKPIPPLD